MTMTPKQIAERFQEIIPPTSVDAVERDITATCRDHTQRVLSRLLTQVAELHKDKKGFANWNAALDSVKALIKQEVER